MKRFSTYLKKLENLDIKNTLLKNEKTVVILSGSSNYESAALSKIQKDFLRIFESYGYNTVNSNFPYNKDFEHNNFENVHIFKASVSNIIYYWHTLYDRKFQKEMKRHLKPLFELDNVIIIAQSSGLNILNHILKNQDIKEKNFKIFSLGPVAQGYGRIDKCTIFKGKNDIYTGILDFHKYDMKVNCGHLDYLKNKEIKEFIHEWLQKNKS